MRHYILLGFPDLQHIDHSLAHVLREDLIPRRKSRSDPPLGRVQSTTCDHHPQALESGYLTDGIWGKTFPRPRAITTGWCQVIELEQCRPNASAHLHLPSDARPIVKLPPEILIPIFDLVATPSEEIGSTPR